MGQARMGEGIWHEYVSPDGKPDAIRRKQDLIRCKDCKHMIETHPLNPITGVPAGITICRCDQWWNPDELPEVDRDGFCSEAELREVD